LCLAVLLLSIFASIISGILVGDWFKL
jgi:hypothetical protein